MGKAVRFPSFSWHEGGVESCYFIAVPFVAVPVIKTANGMMIPFFWGHQLQGPKQAMPYLCAFLRLRH